MPEIIFLWLGLLCLGYFVGIARYVGWTSKFPIVWAGLGAGLLLTGILILTENLSKKAELLCCAMGILLLVSVVVVVAVIASVMFLPVEPDLDYLVVLGAQVMGTRPSLSLQYRIDSACEYLKENPGTRAVLSGGKGPDEGISEARCMYEEMLRQGVDREQLILEDRSASTSQNIEFTRNLLKEKNRKRRGDRRESTAPEGGDRDQWFSPVPGHGHCQKENKLAGLWDRSKKQCFSSAQLSLSRIFLRDKR